MTSVNFRLILEYLPALLQGLAVTFEVAIISLILASVVGLAGGLARTGHSSVLSRIAGIYVAVIRSTPLLVQLYFIYFGLPYLGVYLTAIQSAVLAITLNSGAYITEIFRAGIQSIARGQYEAAMSLGFNYISTLRYIILPQAFRVILPALVGQIVVLIKDTSLLSVLGVVELTKISQMIASTHFAPLEAYITSAIFYLLVCSLFIFLSNYLEWRARRAGFI